MLIRIEAKHFVAGYDLDNGNIAPIIRYMSGWSLYDIVNYCEKKGWECTLL